MQNEDYGEVLSRNIVRSATRFLEKRKQEKIAVLLSGGLDSTIIAFCLIKNLKPDFLSRIEFICLGTPYSSDEVYVKKLQQDLNIPITFLRPLSFDEILMGPLEEVLRLCETSESRVVKVGLFQLKIAKYLQGKARIVYSGEGADELFLGYERYNIHGINMSTTLHEKFFTHIFPKTLLLRFDRVFCGYQIEGRVPFLDQTLIDIVREMPTPERLRKKFLKQFAHDIGIPEYIIQRKKTEMTLGVTGKKNNYTISVDGYLEKEFGEKYSKSAQEVFDDIFIKIFPLSRRQVWDDQGGISEQTIFQHITK